MILVGSLQIGEKEFTMADSERTVYRQELGLPDNFYGGYAKEFRATKYGIYLVLDAKWNILNLAYTANSLTALGRELLGSHEEREDESVSATLLEENLLEFEPIPKISQNKKKETVK